MVRIVHLPGLSDYGDVHVLQQRLVAERGRDEGPDTILLLEHAEVITLGRARGAEANVIRADDVPVLNIERGGDATWHGPGQLVAYPIIGLDGPARDLHRHLAALEDAVIDVVGDLGLAPCRDRRNTGVWLPGGGSALPRKVCSVGIACRRWVTWHGLALNVAPDQSAFDRIRPCGFDAGVMTRLSDHLDPCPDVGALVRPLATALVAHLGLPWGGEITPSP